IEEIGAIAREARELVAEIDITRFFEDLDLVFRSDLVHERLESIAFERRHVDADEFTMNSQHRRIARGEVQIRSVLLLHELKKGIDLCHGVWEGKAYVVPTLIPIASQGTKVGCSGCPPSSPARF